MTTKIDTINGAYTRLRISGLTVNPSPTDISNALFRLEQMMSEYEYTCNMCMDYNFEEFPDPNSLTNVIQPYWGMMETNLAVKLIPDFNKKVPLELKMEASGLYSAAASAISVRQTLELQYPRRMPIGSGNSYRFNRFQRFNHPPRRAPDECATHRMLIGDIDDYRESFRAYLNDNETIAEFEITGDTSLVIVSSSNADPYIDYRIKADNLTTQGGWQQIKIIITTSSGRIETRIVNFELTKSQTVGSTGDDPVTPPGSNLQNIIPVTGNYTIGVDDDIIYASGPGIITLPKSAAASKEVKIKSVLGGGVVLLIPDAEDTGGIDGLASQSIVINSALTVFPIDLGWLIT